LALWPDKAPHANGESEKDQPAVWVYEASEPKTGTAVVICPGGGYAVHAVDHEGTQPARWFNRMGVTVFVLRYRLAPYRHPVPLLDAQRALRYVRHHAADYGLNTDRIGIMGFSAGGHLASTAATHFDNGDEDADDPVDRKSCRPDFVILGYPVVSFQDEVTHRGSVRNLLGNSPDEEQLNLLSNEMQVTKESPPAFLFHTAEDTAVPVENNLRYFAACRAAGVPAELHVFQHGQHGVGLANQHPALSGWISQAGNWLRQNGLLTSEPTQPLRGVVSVDGMNLPWGTVALKSANEHFPVGWSMVMRGKYSIPESAGILPGEYTASIVDMGDVQPQPTVPDAKPHSRTIKVQIEPGQETLNLEF